MAEILVSTLSNFSDKYGLLTKRFELLATEKDYILKILRDIDTSKAAGVDRLPGRFLKDGVNVLAEPVKDICKS